MTARRDRIAFSIAALAIAFVAWQHYKPHAGGDPGGRLLATLKTTEQVIPPNSQVGLRQASEPHWDSCDGRSGTFGWDPASVDVDFVSAVAPRAVLSRAGNLLVAQGWTARGGAQPDGHGLASFWTKSGRAGAKSFTLMLTDNTRERGEWDLSGLATPIGQRAHGC